MGFDINFNKPMIKETQSLQDGGAGNLGYFENEENKKKQKDKSIFEQAQEKEDSFESSYGNSGGEEGFSISRLIAQIILYVKDWFNKIFHV
ncbi:MAG: hypothetical protein PHC64_08315 [Candidatus Gastranaerophilales bacterium]|nr:hypothetical protein [Candidatus Gastranaerophilales bacterium]